MKRKAQTAEFKPPMKRFARISRRNSRENAGEYGETAEIQPTDAKEISATVASSAAPLDNYEEHQPQCSSQPDSDLIDLNIKHPEDAGMEEDTGPKHQTSYEAQLRRRSLDETGDAMLVNIEDVLCAIAVPAKACEEPEPECPKSPPKKRLRRRMGMCGLGERKKRLFIDGQQCRQSPTEAQMADSALKCIDDGSSLLNNEETTESEFLEKIDSSLQQMMTEEASSTEQDIQEIQDLPSETALKIEESNLQVCRTFHCMDMVSEASKVIVKCLDDVEMQYGPTGHDMKDSGMAQTGLPEEEYPVEEEANYGCTDVTDEDSNNGSKDKDEHPVEVSEKQFFGLLGVTSEGSEETANQLSQIAEKVISACSSVASDVSEGSISIPADVAEKMNYSSTGTHEVPEDSKTNAECLVEAEVHHGSTQEIHKGSTEKNNKDLIDVDEGVSHGTDSVTEVCESSREPIEHLVDEAVIVGSTSVTAVCKGSTEQIEHPVDEGVIIASRSVTKVCEVAEDGKYGSAAFTNNVCESSTEVNKLPVADRGIYGSTSVTEVCESSRKPTELNVQVMEEVTNGPIYFIKFCEGSKEWAEQPVELSELEFTNEVSEDTKETIGHPSQMTEEVSYASTAITNDVSEGSREQIENPDQLAKEPESYGSTAVTNKMCEGSAKPVEHPVQLAEEVSYSSTVVTNEVPEGSKEPAGCPVEVAKAMICGLICFTEVTEVSTETSKHPVEVAEKKSYSAIGLANKDCESSEELTGHSIHMTKEVISTTSYVSEGSTDQTENPVHVAEKETCGDVSKELTNHLVQASEGSLDPAGCTVKVDEEESHVCTVNSSDVSEGSTEWTGHPAQVAEEQSYGSTAITNEVSKRLAKEESNGSNTLPKKASEGSRESAKHAVHLSQDESCGSNTVPKEASEGSKELTNHSVQVAEDESCGSNSVPKEASKSSIELFEHSVQVDEDEICGSNTVPEEASERSTEWTVHPAHVAEDESYGSTAITKEVSEGCKELTDLSVLWAEDESYGSNTVPKEASKGSRESTENSAQVVKDEICDSNTVPKEASKGSRESTEHSVQVDEDENCGSITVPKEASEGSKELTDHSILLEEEESYGSTAVANKAFVGSLELIGHPALVAEEESYGSTATITNKVHEGFQKVSMEVQEALTDLEDSEMELDGKCLRVEQDPRRLQLNIQTNSKVEHIDYGLTASTEAAFSEICAQGSQFEHMRLTQMPNTAVEVRSTDPGGKRSSSTEGLMGLKAPPTDQEEFTHDLLSQGMCDLPLTSAIAKLQPICNPNLTLAFTEFSQDRNNIPSSLYSVTDSQLNSITLGMELEDQPTLEGFVHQEDATELVCGLINELSSLNCIVMAAHKEMEVLRRGNRPPKAPIRRSFGLRNSEI